MVQIDVRYLGKLRCEATHEPSGAKILTDAPKDNMGEGASFSPTDSVAMALVTCMITTMGIVAQRNEIDMTGTTGRVTKEMVSEPQRRIGKLAVTIHVPTKLAEKDQQKLRAAAMACPVHRSISHDVEMPVEITFGK